MIGEGTIIGMSRTGQGHERRHDVQLGDSFAGPSGKRVAMIPDALSKRPDLGRRRAASQYRRGTTGVNRKNRAISTRLGVNSSGIKRATRLPEAGRHASRFYIPNCQIFIGKEDHA